MYAISKEAVLGYDCTEHMRLEQYIDNYFVQCLRLNLKDSEQIREISGIDSRGQALEIRLKTTGVADDRNIVIFVETSSSIRCGSGRQFTTVN